MSNKALKRHRKKDNPSPTPTPTPSTSLFTEYRSYLPYVLMLLGFVLYLPAMKYGFIWDDKDYHLHENPAMTKAFFESLSLIWGSVHEGLYIPVTYTLYQLAHLLGQWWQGVFDPTLFHAPTFHLLSILVHLINSYLVFQLLEILFKTTPLAFLGAIFYMVHPIQSESVVWISELKGLLSLHFVLLALRLILLDPAKKMLPAFFFLLAILSKPSSIFFPALWMLMLYFYHQDKKLKSYLVPLVMLLVGLLPMYLTIDSQGKYQQSIWIAPLWLRPLLMLDSLSFYIYKFILPLNISASYGRSPQRLWEAKTVLYTSLPALVGLVLLLFNWKKCSKPFLLGSAVVFLSILPTSGLLTFRFQDWSVVANRYSTFGLFGFIIMVLSFQQKFPRALLGILSGVTFLSFAINAYTIIPSWKNNLTLWGRAIETWPEQDRPFLNRGLYFKQTGKTTEALADFDKALYFNPQNLAALNNMGNIYADRLDLPKALALFDRVLKIDPNEPMVQMNIGVAYFKAGKYQEALEHFNQSEKVYSDSILYMNRGMAYGILGNHQKALEDFKKTLQLDPQNFQALFNLGMGYIRLKDWTTAEESLLRFLKYYPNHSQGMNLLIEVRKELKKSHHPITMKSGLQGDQG